MYQNESLGKRRNFIENDLSTCLDRQKVHANCDNKQELIISLKDVNGFV